MIQFAVELRRRHALKIQESQCGNGGSVTEWRKAARRDDILRFFGRFNARSDDSQDTAVQQPTDDAVLAFGDAYKGREAEVQRGGANQRGRVDRHGAMFEIDPDRVMSGAARDAGNIGGSRTTNPPGGHRTTLSETLHRGSGDEPWRLVILHTVSNSVSRRHYFSRCRGGA